MNAVGTMSPATAVAHGATTGSAWLAALRMTAAANHKLLHLRVTITDPASEDSETRSLADQMLIGEGYPPVQTVVNTVFPAALARSCKDPAELVTRYRRMYRQIKKESPANRRGTYFGRLVCYPARDGEVDQLSRIISHLNRDHRIGRRPSAIYEMTTSTSEPDHGPQAPNMAVFDHVIEAGTSAHDNDHLSAMPDSTNIAVDSSVDNSEMQVYAPTPDTIPMGFPCLSHLSFQRNGQDLHLMAHYRHQYLIKRAYENYLALGLLQRYVAAAADLRVGQLSVNAGLATLDVSPNKFLRYISLLDQRSLW